MPPASSSPATFCAAEDSEDSEDDVSLQNMSSLEHWHLQHNSLLPIHSVPADTDRNTCVHIVTNVRASDSGGDEIFGQRLGRRWSLPQQDSRLGHGTAPFGRDEYIVSPRSSLPSPRVTHPPPAIAQYKAFSPRDFPQRSPNTKVDKSWRETSSLPLSFDGSPPLLRSPTTKGTSAADEIQPLGGFPPPYGHARPHVGYGSEYVMGVLPTTAVNEPKPNLDLQVAQWRLTSTGTYDPNAFTLDGALPEQSLSPRGTDPRRKLQRDLMVQVGKGDIGAREGVWREMARYDKAVTASSCASCRGSEQQHQQHHHHQQQRDSPFESGLFPPTPSTHPGSSLTAKSGEQQGQWRKGDSYRFSFGGRTEQHRVPNPILDSRWRQGDGSDTRFSFEHNG